MAVPVAARIVSRLVLDEHRSRFAATVVDALDSAGCAYWWLPDTGSDDQVLCVAERDRSAVLRVLAGISGPSWYVDLIGADGRLCHRLGQAASVGRRYVSARGIRVWEFVTPCEGDSFIADQSQGLSIYFWRHEEGQLVSLVPNLVVTAVDAADVIDPGSVPSDLTVPLSTVVRFPIDVVFTWVDGMDEAWLRTKAEAADVADPEKFTERAHDDARYADHDELRFSLRALEQFAPWVNHVWIVTADQHPSWLDPHNGWVSVVSHRDIWPDDRGLPTFNSHAIEACLHRIPGLAEHFVYLNDDMLFGRPLRADMFFHSNGIGKFFLSRALVELGVNQTGEIASSTAARNARRLLSQRYGVTFTRKFFHTGASLTVSGLNELESLFPDVFAATRQARFRTLDDVAAAGSFYLNWSFLVGRSVPGSIRYTYIDPAGQDARKRLKTVLKRRSFDAICINDGSTEQTVEDRRTTDRLIREFLAAFLPVPGRFEIG